ARTVRRLGPLPPAGAGRPRTRGRSLAGDAVVGEGNEQHPADAHGRGRCREREAHTAAAAVRTTFVRAALVRAGAGPRVPHGRCGGARARGRGRGAAAARGGGDRGAPAPGGDAPGVRHPGGGGAVVVGDG